MTENYINQALLKDIDSLNNIIIKTNGMIEGNLFYKHWDSSFKINNDYKDKRNNFINFLKNGINFLEIGFNAGHSAALALHNNPNLKYTAVDICHHEYTKLCAKYLIDKFDNFIDLCMGDSKEILNKINFKYDRIHIDGDHSYYGAKSDLIDCYNLLSDDGLILVDDYDFPDVKQAVTDTLIDLYSVKFKGEKYIILNKKVK